MVVRRRLDRELVDRALARSRSEAEDLIGAGRVLVGGAVASKPSRQVDSSEPIRVTAAVGYASRAGAKLEAALDHFAVDVTGRSVLDAGSSTGGFTDCVLRRGAKRVAGFDVGRGQMIQRLRSDPRVTQHDGVNVRHLTRGMLPHRCSLAVVDVSFISLKIVAGPVLAVLDAEGDAETEGTGGHGAHEPAGILLVKPQFEATQQEVSRGSGVIKDPKVHLRVCEEVTDHVQQLGWQVAAPLESPVQGGSGNIEFLLSVTRADRGAQVAP